MDNPTGNTLVGHCFSGVIGGQGHGALETPIPIPLSVRALVGHRLRLSGRGFLIRGH